MKLKQLLELHAALLENNPHCYFELAYTRQTQWMAWICSKPRFYPYQDDKNREVIARGQGATPEEAANAALNSLR